MSAPSWPLQKALYAALTGDAPLMALATGGVHDDPTPDAAMPYIVIGDDAVSDRGDKTTDRFSHLCTLHAFDDRPGARPKLKRLVAAMVDALKDAEITFDDGTYLEWQYVSEQVFRDADAKTWHGTLTIRVITEAGA